MSENRLLSAIYICGDVKHTVISICDLRKPGPDQKSPEVSEGVKAPKNEKQANDVAAVFETYAMQLMRLYQWTKQESAGILSFLKTGVRPENEPTEVQLQIVTNSKNELLECIRKNGKNALKALEAIVGEPTPSVERVSSCLCKAYRNGSEIEKNIQELIEIHERLKDSMYSSADNPNVKLQSRTNEGDTAGRRRELQGNNTESSTVAGNELINTFTGLSIHGVNGGQTATSTLAAEKDHRRGAILGAGQSQSVSGAQNARKPTDGTADLAALRAQNERMAKKAGKERAEQLAEDEIEDGKELEVLAQAQAIQEVADENERKLESFPSGTAGNSGATQSPLQHYYAQAAQQQAALNQQLFGAPSGTQTVMQSYYQQLFAQQAQATNLAYMNQFPGNPPK